MFNDHGFRDRVALSGVNSINWARIMAQIVYYFTVGDLARRPGPAGLLHRADRQFRRHLRRLRGQAHGPADRAAGHRHQRQRHPGPHACRPASYEMRGVVDDDLAVDGHPDLVEFRAAAVRGLRPRRRRGPRAAWAGSSSPAPSTIDADAAGAHPRASSTPAAPTRREVGRDHRARRSSQTGYLLDPHTATAVHVARRQRERRRRPMVALATAHPAKFPAAVEAACGVVPALPDWLAGSDGRARSDSRYFPPT